VTGLLGGQAGAPLGVSLADQLDQRGPLVTVPGPADLVRYIYRGSRGIDALRCRCRGCGGLWSAGRGAGSR
jgi:hypothetical protein